MDIENVIKNPGMRGRTESLPEYGHMCDELLTNHSDNKLVSREELDGVLGPRGNLEMLLMDFVRKGYLLHGSSNSADILKPQQAREKSQDPRNNKFAIYATKVPALALYVSLWAKEKIVEDKRVVKTSFRLNRHLATDLQWATFKADKKPEEFLNNGFVYILRNKNFMPTPGEEFKNWQYVSNVSEEPVLIIPSRFSDFKHEIEITK